MKDAIVTTFDLTVSALVESIISERCTNAEVGVPHFHKTVVLFLLDQHAQMPDYLRFPLKFLTLVFAVWPVPFARRRFHRLPNERRLRQVRSWRNSALGFRRDLIKFYETLTIFGWYSKIYGSNF